MMSVSIPYNPQLIKQAADAAGGFIWEKFPALNEWISEEKKPTVNQLADFAKKVNVPFGYFFLKHLPQKENTVPLFRTGSGKPVYKYSINLQETIDNIKMRQDWLHDYFKGEKMSPLSFVGSAKLGDGIKQIASRIRQKINLPPNWVEGISDRIRS
jgi:hypothetical protein